MPNNMNLHRNIFFKDCAKVPPMPFSALDSPFPGDLWNWMDGQRKAGNELLAISHNANLSDGRMFPTEVDFKGRPIDAAYAASRDRNEPLIEIKQIKGASETHPLLSPNDEFAGFEIMSDPARRPAGPHSAHRRQLRPAGAQGRPRHAGREGLQPVQVRLRGRGGLAQHRRSLPPGQLLRRPWPVRRDDRDPHVGRLIAGIDPRTIGPAGLTGVWAEENTRASIFEAMQRKETFAVSGPHIKVRLFGGWEYTAAMLADAGWVKTGYAKGVPMGGDLPPAKAKAPTFMVWAVKDPTSGNLDRIQIVKGWTKSGQSFEKIFDVVWAGDRKADKWTGVVPPIGNTVDVEKGDVHEHDRRGGAEDRVDRSRVRSEPARVLLRPRAGDPDAALDHDPGREARRRRRPTSCPPPSRSARGARRSGTRRTRKRARTPSRA